MVRHLHAIQRRHAAISFLCCYTAKELPKMKVALFVCFYLHVAQACTSNSQLDAGVPWRHTHAELGSLEALELASRIRGDPRYPGALHQLKRDLELGDWPYGFAASALRQNVQLGNSESQAFELVSDSYNDSLCLQEMLALQQALVAKQFWAMKMFDAFGKPPPEVFNGHMLWLGSISECLNISEPNVKLPAPGYPSSTIEGQFCVSALNITIAPGHFLPAALGICVPSSCNQSIADALLNQVLRQTLKSDILKLSPLRCHQRTIPMNWRAATAIAICSLFVLLILLGTIVDLLPDLLLRWRLHSTSVYTNLDETPSGSGQSADSSQISPSVASILKVDENAMRSSLSSNSVRAMSAKRGLCSRLLVAFSLRANVRKLLFVGKQAPTTLHAVHGIRFISMSWVILGHVYSFPLTFKLLSNTVEIVDLVKRFSFQVIVNGTFSVDTFFVLSGLLLTYLFFNDRERREGKTNWLMYYLHRYWRLTPTYMLILMVYHCLTNYLPTGPVFPQPTNGMDPFCNDNWWTNLLYVNNLVRADKECMGWAWYLANDMQFYVIAPLILVPLAYHWIAGLVSFSLFMIAHLITTAVLAGVWDIPASLVADGMQHGGRQNKHFFADFYVKPYCRIGPYLVGMAFGYLLYRSRCKFRMHWLFWLLGWILAAVIAMLTLYGLLGVNRGDVVLSKGMNIFYVTASRTAWGLAVAWVIFACACGYGGPVNTFLSWKFLVPLSRLTYCAYLVHPFVIDIVLFCLESTLHYSDIYFALLFVGFLVFSYAVAFVATLMFEAPILGIERAMLNKG